MQISGAARWIYYELILYYYIKKDLLLKKIFLNN